MSELGCEHARAVAAMGAGMLADLTPCGQQLPGSEETVPVVAEEARISADRFVRPLAVEDDLYAAARCKPHELVADDGGQRMDRLLLVPEHAGEVAPDGLGRGFEIDYGGARLRDRIGDVAPLIELRRLIAERHQRAGRSGAAPDARSRRNDRRGIEASGEAYAHGDVAA